LHNHYVYAAGQDKTLYLVNIESGECIVKKRNAHKRMFDCVGIYNDLLITISYPCNEISFWNKKTLELVRSINTPLSLSGRTFIENDILYIASRNINGIIWLDLANNPIK
jgi:outer membrane protein assembly factor BamB